MGDKFIPLKPDFVIIPVDKTPMGGDIHESFNVDPNGSVSNGHTTARIPGGQKINIGWNSEK